MTEQGFAQERVASQQQIKVKLRLTDVVVRAAGGEFLKGLKKDDFRLLVNGKEVEVKSVEEFNQLSIADERIQQYVVDLSKAKEKNLPPPPAPTQPRYIILVFDRYNMGVQSTKDSKESAKRFVQEAILPYDQVAVFQYNRNMRHFVGPTSNRKQILEAIERVGGPSSNRLYRPHMSEFMASGTPFREREISALNMQKRIDFRVYINAIKDLASSLSFLPGRKSYLIFSEGPNIYTPQLSDNAATELILEGSNEFPDEIPVNMIENNNLIASQLEQMDLAKQFTLDGFTSTSNSTFYTIRRGQIQPEWVMLLDVQIDFGDVNTLWNANFTSVAQDMARDRLEVLHQVALSGGGKFYDAGFAEKKMFKSLQDEIGNYYVLSFTAPEENVGKFHSLRIEVPGKDVRVSHRKGYWGDKTFAALTGKERELSLETALLTGAGGNELNMETRFFQMPIKNNLSAYMYLQLDPSQLEQDKNGKSEIEQIIAVEDGNGALRFRQHKMFSFDQSVEMNDRLWLTANVPVLPGTSVISVAMRDNISGKISVDKKVLNTRVTGESRLAMTEPIFLLPTSNGNMKEWFVREIQDNVGVVDPISFTGIGVPGMPNHRNAFKQGSDATIFFMVCNIPESFGSNASNIKADFEILCGDRKFRLIQGQMGVQILKNSGSLAVMTSVPIGLAQSEEGLLQITVKNLPDDQMLKVTVPYTILDFAEGKAMDLAKDERILPISE